MKRIPIAAAKRIADQYGYDQVVIIARKVGECPDVHGEHVTTYGVTAEHCASAALQAKALKRFMGWPEESSPDQVAMFSGPPDVREGGGTAPSVIPGATRMVSCLQCSARVEIAAHWRTALCQRCIDSIGK